MCPHLGLVHLMPSLAFPHCAQACVGFLPWGWRWHFACLLIPEGLQNPKGTFFIDLVTSINKRSSIPFLGCFVSRCY